jgi:hypothetical protein
LFPFDANFPPSPREIEIVPHPVVQFCLRVWKD